MCEFVDGENILPGWVCCKDRTYNGFQRTECKVCKNSRHAIQLPENVKSHSCGFAYRKSDELYFRGTCPVCKMSL